MSQSQSNLLAVGKRRLMLYKAIQEFPDNQRIRTAFIRTCSPEHVQDAVENGVYISYNRADELFALELNTELRQMDVNVWLDAIDVDPDEDWEYAVSSALNRSGVMILVLSPQAIDDVQLQEEANMFMELGKIVIPVISERCNTSALNLIMQPIDFSEDFKMGLRLLLKRLVGQRSVRA